jgi:nitroimidazol reductase NimA-like FMN-containing flavoprotein (pyridoxamine 5'-phosphate oxidase superfamily)
MATGTRPAGRRDALPAASGPESPARGSAASRRVLRTLSPAECVELLEPGGVGRVGFNSANGIVILPVNFAVTGRTIIFRTAPDTLLSLYADARVSFETDRYDEANREGWSVLIQGHAHRVSDEREEKLLEARTHLEPWVPAGRDVYVRITPTRISGRRIQPS